jgi:3-hydroxybutyryl-CoA dehydratase
MFFFNSLSICSRRFYSVLPIQVDHDDIDFKYIPIFNVLQSCYKNVNFDDVKVGERFSARQTISDFHIFSAAGLIGDHNPVHIDDTSAKASRFGKRILHGCITSAIMTGPVGMYFHGSAIAYLEHNCKFLRPVYAGDTLETVWTVTELNAKPRHKGGEICMTGVCANQTGDVVAKAFGRILVKTKTISSSSLPFSPNS